ncbi:MAG: YciI family protein [Actinoplanes sp.]
MKFLLALYGDEKAWESLTEEQMQQSFEQHERFTQMLISRNALVSAEALEPTQSARTVRTEDSSVTDGPFAEAVEQFGGYYLVEAADIEEAVELAKQAPEPYVEVRPVMDTP